MMSAISAADKSFVIFITLILSDESSASIISEIIEGGNVIVSLSERALGRVAAKDIKNPISGEIILKKFEMIDEAACEKIDAAGVKIINVFFMIIFNYQYYLIK